METLQRVAALAVALTRAALSVVTHQRRVAVAVGRAVGAELLLGLGVQRAAGHHKEKEAGGTDQSRPHTVSKALTRTLRVSCADVCRVTCRVLCADVCHVCRVTCRVLCAHVYHDKRHCVRAWSKQADRQARERRRRRRRREREIK